MGAGGSDYGGLAQGQIGQGFAQGVESGLNQFNKGLDRKQQQAHTMLNNFVAPNLARLGRPIPMPDTDDPELLRQWQAAEDARQTALSAAVKQAEGLLKQLGNPMDINQFTALYFDPSTAVSTEAQVNVRQNIGLFADLEQRRVAMYNELKAMAPNSLSYAEKFKQYNTFIETEYAPVYRQVRGREYKNDVNDPKVWGAILNREAVLADSVTYLQGIAKVVPDPEIQALIQQQLSAGAGLDLNAQVPGLNMTYRQLFDSAVDKVGLTNLLKQGDVNSITTLVGRLSSMTPEQLMGLEDPALQAFWSSYQQERATPGSTKNDILQAVAGSFRKGVNEVKQSDQAVQLGGLQIQINEQNLELAKRNVTKADNDIILQGWAIKEAPLNVQLKQDQLVINGKTISKMDSDRLIQFGALALEGNPAVLASRDEFNALLGEELTQEEKDQMWNRIVVQNLERYDKKQTQNFEAVQTQINSMKYSNTAKLAELAQQGMLHFLIPRDEKGNIIKAGPMWENVMAAVGQDETRAMGLLLGDGTPNSGLIASSRTAYNNLTAKQKQDLQIGAQNLRAATANATLVSARAKYAEDFALAEKRTAEGQASITLSNATIAKVTARFAELKGKAELGEYLDVMVSNLGADVLDNPEIKKLVVDAFGAQGAEQATQFLKDRQAFKLRAENVQAERQKAELFNSLFSSPSVIRANALDPQKVAAIANQIGADPRQLQLMLIKLAREGSSLSAAQLENIRFALTDGRSRLALAWQTRADDLEQFRLTFGLDRDRFEWQVSTDKRDFQYGKTVDERNFNYQKTRDQVADYWTRVRYWHDVRESAQRQANWLADYYQRQADSATNRRLTLEQLRVQLLQPLQQQSVLMRSQVDDATAGLAELSKKYGPDIAATLNPQVVSLQKKTDEQGNTTYVPVLADQRYKGQFDRIPPAALQEYATLMYRRDAGREALANISSTYNEIITTFKNVSGYAGDLYDVTGDSNGALPNPTPNTGANANPNVAKLDFKTYNAPTALGSSLNARLRQLAAGNSNGYTNFNRNNFCLTLIQAAFHPMLKAEHNYKGGPGGARSWVNQAIADGAVKVYGGKPLTAADIKNLPDGTILFQESGVPEGHIAIVMGGKIVETTKYSQSKISGDFGTTTAEAFVNRVKGPTIAIQIPASWYKPGQGVNAPFSGNNNSTGGGTTPSRNTGGGSTSTPAPKANPAAFVAADGSFASNISRVQASVAGAIKNRNARLIANTDKIDYIGPLTVPYGNQRALISEPSSTMAVIGSYAAQYSTYMKSKGANMAAEVKKNPQAAVDLLVSLLKKDGYGGDLRTFVVDYFRRKGWMK